MWGRETVAFLEIDQPFCVHVYGQAPCTAQQGVTGPDKCFQGIDTCQDTPNYSPGTLALRFGRAQEGMLQYGYVIPTVESVETRPGLINLAGMDRNASPLGQREVVTVELRDHPHSDLLVDKYRLERGFVAEALPRRLNPSAFRGAAHSVARSAFFGQFVPALLPYARGSFWGKWLARNPYHSNYRARIREGYVGQPLSEMRVRHYVIDRIDGPSDGSVTVVLKDLFSLIEERKSVAPLLSRGALNAGIDAVVTSATLTPPGIGNEDYPASGYVLLGNELCAFTRSGDVLTLTRGQLGTVAAAHNADSLVQEVYAEVAQKAHDIIYRLLTLFGGISASEIDKAEWDTLAADMSELYTGYVVRPTAVRDLVGELCEVAGCTVWPDVVTGKIRFAALRPQAASPTVDDRGWIVAGSLTKRLQDDKRVTQVWVHYDIIDRAGDLDDRRNFRASALTADPAAEGPQQYGSAGIREIPSRWIPAGGRQTALNAGARIYSLFRDPPLEARFLIDGSREGALDLARAFTLDTEEVQDELGDRLPTTMVPIALRRSEGEIEVQAQQVKFFASVDPTGKRTLYIEVDSFNVNLREFHDANFAAPVGSEVIEFIVVSGKEIGSTSTALPAIDTGDWPPMATPITLNIIGRCQGKGGIGGNAQELSAGFPGAAGGVALKVRTSLFLTGSGKVWGGGGGGGGGGSSNGRGGGGGGGGSGTNVGDGGLGAVVGGGVNGANGSPGTSEDGGAGGAGGCSGGFCGGNGGPGGGPGQDGTAGAANLDAPIRAGGAGGAAGAAIDGASLVTIDGGATLDIRGAQIN